MKKARKKRGQRASEALALDYNPTERPAPRVVAKGKGILADRIIEVARKAGVPIREDPLLVSLLAHIEVDREIPAEAYKVVAELLAWVYTVHNRWKTGETDESHGHQT
jgi:flagellar biosynthesis protein